ncbi:MAG: aminodeoxychorismate synthase component I, partial [Kaistella sp.]
KENTKLYFKSGGGITHLSKAADEYQEMKNKIYVPIY